MHIHSHGAEQAPSDLDFSRWTLGAPDVDYDAELIANNENLSFYLYNPAGDLIVWGVAGPENQNPTNELLASGFPWDENVEEKKTKKT